MTQALVYLPVGGPGPGQLSTVELDVIGIGPRELTLADVTVRDERDGELFDDQGLVFDPAAGGGPLAAPGAQRQARAFGVTNTAFHAQRALRFAADLLGRRLPHLVIRIGIHDADGHWGGGHYRLPGRCSPPEPGPVRADGEVHLGGGRAFLSNEDGRYFLAPSHNMAIVYHEVGHHVCRHTADFRLNRLREREQQSSRKTALDEGTADLLTAVLLGSADIYGWHRCGIPIDDPRRRRLDQRWTMAHFCGGRQADPHSDGTIWASALWSARQQIVADGGRAERFDAALLRGLALFGLDTDVAVTGEALRQRRYFSRLLAKTVEADPALAPALLSAMAEHGIFPGASNSRLRDEARAACVATR